MAVLDYGNRTAKLAWLSERIALHPGTFNHEQIWSDWDSAFVAMKHVDQQIGRHDPDLKRILLHS
jgi:hypothetical protein